MRIPRYWRDALHSPGYLHGCILDRGTAGASYVSRVLSREYCQLHVAREALRNVSETFPLSTSSRLEISRHRQRVYTRSRIVSSRRSHYQWGKMRVRWDTRSLRTRRDAIGFLSVSADHIRPNLLPFVPLSRQRVLPLLFEDTRYLADDIYIFHRAALTSFPHQAQNRSASFASREGTFVSRASTSLRLAPQHFR